MSAEPGETALWTEQDEHELIVWSKVTNRTAGFMLPFSSTACAMKFSREILRLRAENERLIKDIEYMLKSARTALAAATRERETPPDFEPTCSTCGRDAVGHDDPGMPCKWTEADVLRQYIRFESATIPPQS